MTLLKRVVVFLAVLVCGHFVGLYLISAFGTAWGTESGGFAVLCALLAAIVVGIGVAGEIE